MRFLFLVAVLACSGTQLLLLHEFMGPVHNAHYQVCFTPGENCTQQIIDEITKAKRQILVEAYSFTSKPISNALVDAKQRGVDIKILLDKSQIKAKYSSFSYLKDQNIWLKIDYKPAIAHNKIMIVDNMTTITGSFNFTNAAQKRNAENVLIISDSNLARIYTKNWIKRESESKYAIE